MNQATCRVERPALLDTLPLASFDAAVDCTKKISPNPFVVQIGAMDGCSFDTLNKHLMQGGWHGILVEPLPDMFEALQKTYAAHPELTLVNRAISDHEGFLTLYRITPAALKMGLPPWLMGTTTSMTDRSLFPLNEGFKSISQKVEAPCSTLQKLFDDHHVDHIDVVVIDAEGADWLVAKQLDLTRYAPHVVFLEYDHLLPAELKECCAYFTEHGYQAYRCREEETNILFCK